MIVYLARNLKNGKCYVGITSKSLRHRITNHKYANLAFGAALRKYGEAGFEIKIIDRASTPEELSEKERYWINHLNCQAPRGYNMTTGGEFRYKLSAESCCKISESKKGKARPDMKPEDLTGIRFGRLTVVRLASGKPSRWLCACDCGREHSVVSTLLKGGKCRSCGCLRSETTKARHAAYRKLTGKPMRIRGVSCG